MAETEYRGWKYLRRTDFEDEKVVRYTIAFYLQSDDWYDEIRYDSHERKKGRSVLAPHFHLKLRSAFKGDAGRAIEEIKEIIDNYVNTIGECFKDEQDKRNRIFRSRANRD